MTVELGNYHVDIRPLYGYDVLVSNDRLGASIKINELEEVGGEIFWTDKLRLLDVRGNIIDDPEVDLYVWGRVAAGPHKGKLLISVEKTDEETEKTKEWDLVVPVDRIVTKKGKLPKLKFSKEIEFSNIFNELGGY